jgi:hypothetical protein
LKEPSKKTLSMHKNINKFHATVPRTLCNWTETATAMEKGCRKFVQTRAGAMARMRATKGAPTKERKRASQGAQAKREDEVRWERSWPLDFSSHIPRCWTLLGAEDAVPCSTLTWVFIFQISEGTGDNSSPFSIRSSVAIWMT